MAAVARAGVTGAVGSGQRGQWAGVRARQPGAAGAASGQGSRQWARGTVGRRGACVGRRRRAARPSVRRSVHVPVTTSRSCMEVAWQRSCALSATAASRAGWACAVIAAATAALAAAMCAARVSRPMTCVLVAADVPVRVRCDMLEYARAQMSCIRVFYLSGIAGECIFNTQIPRHAQPTRACKIHCMRLAVAAAHVDWRATHQHNPPRGQNAGGASSVGSTIEPDELPRRKRRPRSPPQLCVGRRTGIERGGRVRMGKLSRSNRTRGKFHAV